MESYELRPLRGRIQSASRHLSLSGGIAARSNHSAYMAETCSGVFCMLPGCLRENTL